MQALTNAIMVTLSWIHSHSAEDIMAKMPEEMVGKDKALYLAALKNTIPMVTVGTVAAIVIGMITGILSAWRRGSAADHVSTNAAIFFYAFPTQWLGLMLLIAGPDVIRMAPALIVSDAQIAEADRILRAAVDEFLAAA